MFFHVVAPNETDVRSGLRVAQFLLAQMSPASRAAIAASFLVANANAQSNCAEYTNGDWQINGVDLAVVPTSWGVCQSNP